MTHAFVFVLSIGLRLTFSYKNFARVNSFDFSMRYLTMLHQILQGNVFCIFNSVKNIFIIKGERSS